MLTDAFGMVPLTGRVQYKAPRPPRQGDTFPTPGRIAPTEPAGATTFPTPGRIPLMGGNDPWAEDKAAVKLSLGYAESGNRYNITNSEGYRGKYQFGDERLQDLGYGDLDRQAFLNDPTGQERIMDEHLAKIDREIAHYGLDKYEGQTIGGVPINRRALYGMMHLGGPGSTQEFLQSGGAIDRADSNDTHVGRYGKIHGASKNFSDRQGAEVADIQVDMQNGINEMNEFENNTAMLFATPKQLDMMQKFEPFEPQGRPTVQGNEYDAFGNVDPRLPNSQQDQLDMPWLDGLPDIGGPAARRSQPDGMMPNIMENPQRPQIGAPDDRPMTEEERRNFERAFPGRGGPPGVTELGMQPSQPDGFMPNIMENPSRNYTTPMDGLPQIGGPNVRPEVRGHADDWRTDFPNTPPPGTGTTPAGAQSYPNTPPPGTVPTNVTADTIIKDASRVPSASEVAASPQEGIQPANWWNRLEALGIGLSQMSGGSNVNVGDVWNRNIAGYNAETGRYNAETGRQNANTSAANSQQAKVQEQRLRAAFDAEQQALVGEEAGRMALATHYLQKNPDDTDGAMAIFKDKDAAKQYAETFAPPKADTGDTPMTPETIEAIANAAANNPAYGPEVAANIRADASGTLAKEMSEEVYKKTGSERENANSDPVAIENAILSRMRANPDEAEALQRHLDDLEAAKATGSPEKINSVADALAEYTKQKNAQGVKDASVIEAEQRQITANRAYVSAVSGDDPALDAQMAAAAESPSMTVTGLSDMRDGSMNRDAAEEEIALTKQLNDDVADAMIDRDSDPAAVAAARAGDFRQAFTMDAKDKEGYEPTSIKELRLMMKDPKLMEAYIEAKRPYADPRTLASLDIWKKRAMDAAAAQVSESKRLDAAKTLQRFIVENDGMSTGMLQHMTLPAQQLAKDLFGTSFDDLSAKEALQAMSIDLARKGRQPGEGHMSDYDAKMLERIVPSLRNTRLGNLMIGQIQINSARRGEAKAKAMEQFFHDPNNDLQGPDVMQRMNDYVSKQLEGFEQGIQRVDDPNTLSDDTYKKGTLYTTSLPNGTELFIVKGQENEDGSAVGYTSDGEEYIIPRRE